MNEIFIDEKISEKRFATKETDQVSRLFIEQPHDETKVGNIYFGKVVDVKNGMNACFIDIGSEKHGYLHRDQLPFYLHNDDPNKKFHPISKFISKGESILVQVKKDETNIKGPLLTALIEINGDKLIYLPEGEYIAVSKKGNIQDREKWRTIANNHKQDHEGFIIRTEAFDSTEEEWRNELESLRKRYQHLLNEVAKVKSPALIYKTSLFEKELFQELTRLKEGRVISNNQNRLKEIKQYFPEKWEYKLHISDENIFSYYKIESEIDRSLKRLIWLENGSYIVIDETEALISIDVNTGKFSGTKGFEDTVLKTNILAAKEMVRQVLIRDYGGMILVDFIDMKSEKDRHLVLEIVKNEFKQDSKHTRVIGFSPLGILQLTRKKTKKSLSETLLNPCPVCAGRGKVESRETIAFRLERELWEKPFKEHEAVFIELTEDVKIIFCGENDVHLKRLEQLLGIQIYLSIIPSCRPIYYIRQFGTKEELAKKMSN
ncbi:Rne/Rng family ribonuclease [Heyndrickxia oleronia]|jgi:ribonuclease G|uniref:Ribonuclease E/G n=1 Tax=Heyndrickxia oleronia TaxID=38875 RepID=A0A8E2LF24_9BACI|nr:Rne/Rng family ribonuclease [Heyndrickxia oleronia]NYV64441.1 Rne/Rng family ribonuclease [Bacillus sp. Gen3]MBU5213566.1 Rne/Rng family ribonuclease [Heyndrickxia oleronia]MCI1590354.1 Rne/Rng family ribonuclease [Heyndrickxia oleronia]MCI1614136.1 Rne/Rng family ribonuclease [Heyndrickxia oleronia]MCI1745290.1 Rne/Rng family ribonuclease [Heyndrickxia oleronia]